jgi:pilus assembly protein Flp/PilA
MELKTMSKYLRFFRNESGATAIEYGLIAALIGLAIVAGATAVGNSLNGFFTDIGSRLDAAQE